MYYVTRHGVRIAGSIAVSLDMAVRAADILNREYRCTTFFRAEFGVQAAEESVRAERCEHRNMAEIGITNECDHGCKIMVCACGHAEVSHRDVYGCPMGRMANTSAMSAL